ncbi:two component transcriptional regulator, LuxR family [Sanguibacter gelidistatuariae]|uniref:Two component transcriptional regulator, LuxR family n=1 Tax=Sanguibacter gelidistatuariae TaxID=1814289 RepID=A0A1G6H6C2_9MICO|nr:response regulator transcription factor [Sanguibacter gelidistatuariae]SDB89688.1 two component transcriptional regulator, LuxR family [Sanguibacter gelidistatuariae]
MTSDDAPVRVVIVDDDALVRSGLRLILGGDRTIDVVGEASDGEQALTVIAATVPDVVLMDIRMPRTDGLAATARALAARPDLKILILTTFDTDDLVLEALRIGARGFLLKDTQPAQLVTAVRAVAAGQPMLSPSVTGQLIAALNATPRAVDQAAAGRLTCLTTREREVAVAISRGLTNAQIAETLFMSVATVKSHVGHLFTKLGVDNRVQVANCVRDAE